MTVYNRHIHDVPEGAVVVMRPTKWGNRFVIGMDGDRGQVIEAYRKELWSRISSGEVALEDLADLDGKDLVCVCTPKPCHADVLERAAAWAARKLGRAPIGSTDTPPF